MIGLTVSFANPDSAHETVSDITVSGLPETANLFYTNEAGDSVSIPQTDGQAVITAEQAQSLYLIDEGKLAKDFNLTYTATVTEDGQSKVLQSSTHVALTPDAKLSDLDLTPEFDLSELSDAQSINLVPLMDFNANEHDGQIMVFQMTSPLPEGVYFVNNDNVIIPSAVKDGQFWATSTADEGMNLIVSGNVSGEFNLTYNLGVVSIDADAYDGDLAAASVNDKLEFFATHDSGYATDIKAGSISLDVDPTTATTWSVAASFSVGLSESMINLPISVNRPDADEQIQSVDVKISGLPESAELIGDSSLIISKNSDGSFSVSGNEGQDISDALSSLQLANLPDDFSVINGGVEISATASNEAGEALSLDPIKAVITVAPELTEVADFSTTQISALETESLINITTMLKVPEEGFADANFAVISLPSESLDPKIELVNKAGEPLIKLSADSDHYQSYLINMDDLSLGDGVFVKMGAPFTQVSLSEVTFTIGELNDTLISQFAESDNPTESLANYLQENIGTEAIVSGRADGLSDQVALSSQSANLSINIDPVHSTIMQSSLSVDGAESVAGEGIDAIEGQPLTLSLDLTNDTSQGDVENALAYIISPLPEQVNQLTFTLGDESFSVGIVDGTVDRSVLSDEYNVTLEDGNLKVSYTDGSPLPMSMSVTMDAEDSHDFTVALQADIQDESSGEIYTLQAPATTVHVTPDATLSRGEFVFDQMATDKAQIKYGYEGSESTVNVLEYKLIDLGSVVDFESTLGSDEFAAIKFPTESLADFSVVDKDGNEIPSVIDGDDTWFASTPDAGMYLKMVTSTDAPHSTQDVLNVKYATALVDLDSDSYTTLSDVSPQELLQSKLNFFLENIGTPSVAMDSFTSELTINLDTKLDMSLVSIKSHSVDEGTLDYNLGLQFSSTDSDEVLQSVTLSGIEESEATLSIQYEGQQYFFNVTDGDVKLESGMTVVDGEGNETLLDLPTADIAQRLLVTPNQAEHKNINFTLTAEISDNGVMRSYPSEGSEDIHINVNPIADPVTIIGDLKGSEGQAINLDALMISTQGIGDEVTQINLSLPSDIQLWHGDTLLEGLASPDDSTVMQYSLESIDSLADYALRASDPYFNGKFTAQFEVQTTDTFNGVTDTHTTEGGIDVTYSAINHATSMAVSSKANEADIIKLNFSFNNEDKGENLTDVIIKAPEGGVSQPLFIGKPGEGGEPVAFSEDGFAIISAEDAAHLYADLETHDNMVFQFAGRFNEVGDSFITAFSTYEVDVYPTIQSTSQLTLSEAEISAKGTVDLDSLAIFNVSADESAFLSVSHIPEGWTVVDADGVIQDVSYGFDGPPTVLFGNISIPSNKLEGMKLVPPTDYEGTSQIRIGSYFTEKDPDSIYEDGGQITSKPIVGELSVTVEPELDSTFLQGSFSMLEDVGRTMALRFTNNGDTDESVNSVTLHNIPDGSTITVGGRVLEITDGSVTFTPAEAASFKFMPPQNMGGTINFGVTAEIQDGQTVHQYPADGNPHDFPVKVIGIADAPELSVDLVGSGESLEGALVSLDGINAQLTDVDGSEHLVVTVTINNGAHLVNSSGEPLIISDSIGSINQSTDGSLTTYVLTGKDGQAINFGDMFVQASDPDYSGDVIVNVSAKSVDIAIGTQTNSSKPITSGDITLTYSQELNTVLESFVFKGNEDTVISTPIHVETAAGESVGQIEVNGFLSGSHVSYIEDGELKEYNVESTDTVLTLSAEQATTLSVMPPADSSQNMALTYTATITEGSEIYTVSQTAVIDVQATIDQAPAVGELTVDVSSGDSISLAGLVTIESANDVDHVSVYLNNLPEGTKVIDDAGNELYVQNAAAQAEPYEMAYAQVSGASIVPPEGYVGPLHVDIRAVAADIDEDGETITVESKGSIDANIQGGDDISSKEGYHIDYDVLMPEGATANIGYIVVKALADGSSPINPYIEGGEGKPDSALGAMQKTVDDQDYFVYKVEAGPGETLFDNMAFHVDKNSIEVENQHIDFTVLVEGVAPLHQTISFDETLHSAIKSTTLNDADGDLFTIINVDNGGDVDEVPTSITLNGLEAGSARVFVGNTEVLANAEGDYVIREFGGPAAQNLISVVPSDPSIVLDFAIVGQVADRSGQVFDLGRVDHMLNPEVEASSLANAASALSVAESDLKNLNAFTGDFGAAGDAGADAAEPHSGAPGSIPVGEGELFSIAPLGYMLHGLVSSESLMVTINLSDTAELVDAMGNPVSAWEGVSTISISDVHDGMVSYTITSDPGVVPDFSAAFIKTDDPEFNGPVDLSVSAEAVDTMTTSTRSIIEEQNLKLNFGPAAGEEGLSDGGVSTESTESDADVTVPPEVGGKIDLDEDGFIFTHGTLEGSSLDVSDNAAMSQLVSELFSDEPKAGDDSASASEPKEEAGVMKGTIDDSVYIESEGGFKESDDHVMPQDMTQTPDEIDQSDDSGDIDAPPPDHHDDPTGSGT